MQSFTAFSTRRQALGIGFGLTGAVTGCAPSNGAPNTGQFAALARLSAQDRDAVMEAPLQVSAAATGDPYAPLRRALADVSRRDGRATVLQIGDSHTAGAAWTGRLRSLFQDRYGAVGPGRLAPGAPHRWYRPNLVQLEQTGNWQGTSALRSSTPGPFGLACYRLSGAEPGSVIRLRSTESQGFDRLMIDLWLQPGGGEARLGVDGQWSPAFRTAGPGRAHRIVIDLPGRHQEAALEILGGGPVDLLDWGVDRRGPGVLVEGHGVSGATIDMLGNLDQRILQRDLAAAPPALIILAFGTNEAAGAGLTEDGYAAKVVDRIRMVKRLSPGSGILLVGAPDTGRPGHGPGSCQGVRPLPSLEEVQAAQRRAARAERVGYWDWAQEVTGGVCRLGALAQGSPAIMQRDHVHFTADGYRLTAERMFEHIMRQVSAPQTRSA